MVDASNRSGCLGKVPKRKSANRALFHSSLTCTAFSGRKELPSAAYACRTKPGDSMPHAPPPAMRRWISVCSSAHLLLRSSRLAGSTTSVCRMLITFAQSASPPGAMDLQCGAVRRSSASDNCSLGCISATMPSIYHNMLAHITHQWTQKTLSLHP